MQWLTTSVWPYVWRWYADDIRSFVPDMPILLPKRTHEHMITVTKD